MSEYYELVGALTFPSSKDARDAVATLRAVHDGEATFFWTPPPDPDDPDDDVAAATDLVLEGSVLRISWKGFAGGAESYYTTRRLLEEVAHKALSGRVGLKEGEDGRLEYFSAKRRAKPTAGTKKAAPRKSAPAKALPTIDCDEPLIVLARGYARLWEAASSPRLFAKALKLKAPAKIDMGNVDALVLPAGPPTAFHRDGDRVLLLRAEAGDNAALAEAALGLPARAWKPIKCRMTGGSHGAILVFKASTPGARPNLGTKGLRIPVAKRAWPHIYYAVTAAKVSKTIDGRRVAGSVIQLARK